MVLEILVNIGSGKGLLPDGTKPLPEPKLTCHQWSLVALTWQQFNCSRYRFIRMSLKIALLRLYPHLTEDNIRPCNLVNYTVEVHKKTIHFFLSVSHSYIHTRTPALTIITVTAATAKWLKSSSDSESLSESERSRSLHVWLLVRIWVREGISGSLWIRSVWKWQNKVLKMTTTYLW